MAIVPMQKIQLLVHKDEKPKLVDFLQNKGVLQIVETPVGESEVLAHMDLGEEGHQLEYDVAQLDFAVNFLKKYETEKKGLQAMLDGDAVFTDPEAVEKTSKQFAFKEVVSRCESVEEELTSLHNEKKALKAKEEKLYPWSQLTSTLDTPRTTEHVESLFIVIPLKDWAEFRAKVFALSKLIVLECDNIYNGKVYAHLIVDKSLVTEVNGIMTTYKAERAELPEVEGKVTDELERIEKRISKIEEREGQLITAAKELAKDLKKLRIVYDTLNWKLQQKHQRKQFAATESIVFITGWMPKQGLSKIREELEKQVTKNFELNEIDPDEGESAPVLICNRPLIRPFRAVTDVYGLPLYNEVDPTPFLAIFFIVFFGMCLTDAGYGLLMFALTWAALKYLRIPKGMQNLVRLLMYGGIFTFVIGILFGGWFGLTPEQAPAWMTTVVGDKLMFKGQTFDALGNAIQVLVLSLALGYFQTWFGVWLNFIHNFRHSSKKDALLDNFPWAYILTVIGLLIMIAAGILPESIQPVMMILLYIGIALIVLTQGRKKSNIVLKFFSGILSLYDLVGYMSAVLSYSRLLALGLATAIIGMAVNTIAALANGVPYVGIIFAIIVLIVGHVFNLGINALGSFIHSGRLQFVEFFGNFLEGGGSPFRPLKRDSKFVHFEK